MSEKSRVSAALIFFILLTPVMTSAKRGSNDEGRVIHQGIIQSMPSDGLHGDWLIGDRAVSTAPDTEFDQTDGQLTITGCAKIEFRNGRVHEIDSEPLSDCK